VVAASPPPDAASPPPDAAAPSAGWAAELALEYERRGERSVLARRAHRGPLRVQRDLYPEGPSPCHTLLVHPPGGIAGGDSLAVRLRVGAAAEALVTTPGASKWYRSAGRPAEQRLELELGAGGALEWLPQESIFFDEADAGSSLRVRLGAGARYLGWEVLCLGRQAAGERFTRGELRLSTEVWRGARCLWRERARLRGGDPLLTSPIGLAGAPVCATLIAAAPELDDDARATELLAACRAVDPAGAGGGRGGVTRLPGVLLARWLGRSGEQARGYLTALWGALRPRLWGRAAAPPRIWAT
jgi:urease accessory protein